ncbi:MAG: hypothetical protein LBN34_09065 [Clostridiales Family XIII bacterium]|jgi:hypothetical protein|nr:hypothetical protein [Clostridiales Family XIII bacterium]
MSTNNAERIEEIKKVLYEQAPFPVRLKRIKAMLDLVDFAYTNVKLDGSRLTESGVNQILDGEILEDVPIKEHVLVNAHRDIYIYMEQCASMMMDVDSRMVLSFFSKLTGLADPVFRTGSEPIYHLDIVPKKYGDMEAAIKEALLEVRRTDFKGDYIVMAAAIHTAIIKVYPFEEKSEMVARCALQYVLMRNGLYPLAFQVNETEYNVATINSLNGSYEAFSKIIIDAVIAKTDKLIEIVLGS